MPCNVIIPAPASTSGVPQSLINPQNWDPSYANVRGEVTIGRNRDTINLRCGDSGAVDSTSIGSNVDTLDSGFSSERFNTLHSHHRPALPENQVTLSLHCSTINHSEYCHSCISS